MGSTADIFTTTTAAIVAAIQHGAGTWTMPWSTDTIDFPVNPTTNHLYRGGNVLTLLAAAHTNHYPTGQWATHKQWAGIGAQVRRGEHGTACIWWNISNDNNNNKNNNNNDNNQSGRTAGPSASRGTRRTRVLARSFVVVNAAQVDGHTPTRSERDTSDRIADADEFFTAIGANVVHRNDGIAAYAPESDLIILPPRTSFREAPSYYATSAHEHAHWTGHPTRLQRDFTGRFGSDAYAVEELVAELSAAFTCAVLGISTTPRPDHAAYLAHWLDILHADPKALHTIAGKAQAATDHLLQRAGRRPHHEPLTEPARATAA